MNQQDLKYFIRVSELNSISKVAQENNVTPSSVSGRISNLERSLGSLLFLRNGKHIQLNKSGEIVYHHATRINNLMADAQRELCDKNDRLDYEISVSSLTIPRVMPLILRGFREKYPSIKLSIAQYQKKQAITDMNCDIMLYSTNEQIRSASAKTVYAEPILLLASNQHPLANYSEVSPMALVGEQFIRASEIADFGQLTTLIMKQLGIDPEIAIVSDYPEFVMELVSANMGLSFQPGLTYQFYHRNQNITPIRIRDFSPVRYITIAWDNSRYYSKAVDTFVQYVCSYLQDMAASGIPGQYIG